MKLNYNIDAGDEVIANLVNLKAQIEHRERWKDLNWNIETDEPINGYRAWDEMTADLNSEIAYAAELLIDALKIRWSNWRRSSRTLDELFGVR